MMKKILAAFVAAMGLAASAQAGEVYGNVGLPGVMLGYAQPVSDSLTLRADLGTLGSHDKDYEESGINYQGTAKLHRAGVFADWFAFGGGFRFTGGATFQNARLDLTADGAGQSFDIGGQTVVLAPGDRFDVRIKYPSVMPYLGIGYGHQPSGTGWGSVFDLGVSIGKPKVTGKVSGPTLSGQVSQEDVDAELAELRDDVGDIKVLPQLSIGVNYRF